MMSRVLNIDLRVSKKLNLIKTETPSVMEGVKSFDHVTLLRISEPITGRL